MSKSTVRILLLLALVLVVCVAAVGPAYAKPPKNASSLVATAVSPTQIDLVWQDNSTDETGFRIERKLGVGGTWEYLDTTPGDADKGQEYYSDTTCSPDTEYCYQVIAFNGDGDAPPSPTACDTTPPGGGGPPAAPSNLIATAASSSQVDLVWQDNSSDETGFKIEVDEGNTGTFVYLDQVGANVTSYPDTGLTAGTEYCYRVYAYNGEGDSGYSNADCATPTLNPPAAPTNLVATAVSETQVNLVWDDNSSNEDGFNIEVDEGNTGTFVYLDTVGADVTSYPDTGLSEGTEYCYRVYATNTYGDSAYSNVDCATPQSGQVVVVSNFQELKAAAQAATPGTIIELLDGIYYLDNPNGLTLIDKSGITFRSQSGNREAVVLQGEGISDRDTQFTFKLYNCHYITVQDMTMTEVYWHHFQLNEGCNYVTIQNCVMWDAGEGPIKTTVTDCANPEHYSDFGLVEDCVIGYTTYGVRTVVEGIDLIASENWVIRDTDFINVMKRNSIGWGFFCKANGADTVVENCYFENCGIAISFGGGLAPESISRYCDDSQEHRRGIMRNNVVHLTLDVAIYMAQALDFKVYNNTLWSTFKLADSSIDVRYHSYGEIFNNICSEGWRLREAESQATLSNNIFFADANLFVDQANADYHLVATATDAIDQGCDTTADVPYDMDWEARPKGSAVDIGADEF